MATGDCFTGPTDLREFSARLGMQTAGQRTAELVRAPTYPRKLKSSSSYHLLSPPVQPIVVDRFIEIVNWKQNWNSLEMEREEIIYRKARFCCRGIKCPQKAYKRIQILLKDRPSACGDAS